MNGYRYFFFYYYYLFLVRIYVLEGAEKKFYLLGKLFVVLKRTDLFFFFLQFLSYPQNRLFRTGVFRHGLGTFGDGVLGQFAGQQETDGGLNLPAGYGRTFVVMCQTGGFGGDAFEYVVYETVHYAHRLARDSGVGMDLLQHLVDVDGVAFLPPALLFLVALRNILLSLSRFLGGLTAGFWWHFDGTSNEITDVKDDIIDTW